MNKILFALTIILSSTALPTFAADHGRAHDSSKISAALTLEDREKLAGAHQHMAACLRTTQEFKACHESLRTECKSLSSGYCPGMEKGNKMTRKRMSSAR